MAPCNDPTLMRITACYPAALSFALALPFALGLPLGMIRPASASVPASAVDGDADCAAESAQCVGVGRWNFSVALGAGDRTNPLAGGKDIPLVVIPQFSYYGERFFIDDLDLGVTLADTAANSFNLIATPGYDRVFFFRDDLQNFFIEGVAAGVKPPKGKNPGSQNQKKPQKVAEHTPRVTYLVGPEWTFKFDRVTGQLDALEEATGQNGGTEIRGALNAALWQSTATLSATAGFTWKSSAIVNCYYGVNGIYAPGSAFDPFVKLRYSRPLGRRWSMEAFVEYEQLGRSIIDSPIVAQRHVGTAFVGAVYSW